MQETGQGSHQSRLSPEFKFWENIFNGLRFLYDILNVEGDVTKATQFGPQQLAANPGAYLMRSAMMARTFFEAGDESKKAEHCLSKEVTKLKEALKIQAEKSDKTTQKLAEKLKKLEEEAEKLKKDNANLNKDNEALKGSLKEAQVEVMSSGYKALDKAKAHALILQPDLNVATINFFKIIRDGQLVKPDSHKLDVEGVPKRELPVQQTDDDPVSQPDQ